MDAAEEIYQAVKKYSHSLFAENLRFKLVAAAKMAIGAEIKRTIIQQPGALLLFNNGLTFVASTVGQSKNRKKLVLVHPQIVNGCQTSWAIFEAFNEMPSLLRRAYHVRRFLSRSVSTNDDPGLAGRIAICANEQNAISDRDLKANQTIQRTIQVAFDQLKQPVYYEYKEGGVGTLLAKQRARFNVPPDRGRRPMRLISNVLAEQLYLAIIGSLLSSKQDKNLIFSSYYKRIFEVDLYPDVRFGDLHASNAKTGVMAFRDDVIFAFSIYQLAEAIKGLFERKLALYEEHAPLTPLEMRAERTLATVGSYHKFWQYLLIACINEIAELWAKQPGVGIQEIRRLLLGDDLNPFFRSQRVRHKFFRSGYKS